MRAKLQRTSIHHLPDIGTFATSPVPAKVEGLQFVMSRDPWYSISHSFFRMNMLPVQPYARFSLRPYLRAVVKGSLLRG